MTKEDIKTLYEHGMLEISDDKLNEELENINSILEYADKIFDLDVENVKPLEMLPTHKARLRKDEVKESLDREEALKNAHDREYGYFRLKKVL